MSERPTSERQTVSSGAVWEPLIGYSRAVRVGSWVSVAGTTAARPDGGVVGGDDIAEQTREAIRRIEAALREVGASLEHVVRTRMFVTDISRWEEVGRAHGEFFAAIRPAASMLEIKGLIEPELLVEVEADAIIPT
jgi:enamine deaminase RidA (YjgF/YER057c/UK114 family)